MKATTSARGHETTERRKRFIAELKTLLKRSRRPNQVPASRREQLLG